MSFVQKTLDSFNIRSSKTTLLVDMFGYDGFPALASIQEIQFHLAHFCCLLGFENTG